MSKFVSAISCFALIMASSVGAHAQSGAALQQADPQVRQLLVLMDKDKSGKVSRDEFMAFMAAEFDRLDVNKDGELDISELQGLRVAPRHPGGAGTR